MSSSGSRSPSATLRDPPQPREEPFHGPHLYLYRFIAGPRYQSLLIRLTFDYFRRLEPCQGPRSPILGDPARPFFSGKALQRVKTAEPLEKDRQFEVLLGGRLVAAVPNRLRGSGRPLREPSQPALNRIHGEWDEAKLGEVLRELEMLGADMDLTGFAEAEIEARLRGDDQPVDGLTDLDDVPEPPDDPATQRNDLIVMGQHRLLAFRDRMCAGDLLVVAPYLSDSSSVAIARIIGPYEFVAEFDGQDEAYAHRRAVQWLATNIPRGELPVSVSRGLKQGTLHATDSLALMEFCAGRGVGG